MAIAASISPAQSRNAMQHGVLTTAKAGLPVIHYTGLKTDHMWHILKQILIYHTVYLRLPTTQTTSDTFYLPLRLPTVLPTSVNCPVGRVRIPFGL